MRPADANHDSIDVVSARAPAALPNAQPDKIVPSEKAVVDSVKIRPMAESIPARRDRAEAMIPQLAMKGLHTLAEKLQTLLSGDVSESVLDQIISQTEAVLARLKKR